MVNGHEEIVGLAAGADVLIECGAIDVDLDALRRANPALITLSLSPFGADGPKADWLGTDLTINAASGEMSLNGYKDRAPVRISAPQVWVNAGAEAACAALLALTDRARSDLGQHIDVSAQEAMMLTAQGWLTPALCGNPSAQRSGGGLELFGAIRFRFVYQCLDGHVTVTFLPGVLVGGFTNQLLTWANAEGALADDLAAIDWVDLLMGGYYELTGWPDRLPAGPFLAYTDATSPRLTAAVVLAALDWRRRTGQGMSIDFSQAEGGIHFLSEAVLDQEVNGFAQTRMGNADRWIAPHGAYRCGAADRDDWIAIACETDEHCRTLANQLGRDDLGELAVAERLDRRAELDEIIGTWTAGQHPVELHTLLQAARIPAHHVQNSPEVVADPQLVHRDHFHEVPHATYGHTWAEQYGFRLSRSVGTPRQAGPHWGEHTFEILTDLLGYDVDRIGELAIAQVLE